MSELALQLIAENKRTQNPFLDLSKCALKKTLPNTLIDCIWIEKLDIGNWEKNKSGGMTLTFKDNKNNTFYGKELEILANLPNLKILNLDGCQIRSLSFTKNLTDLQEISLGHNKISNIRPLERNIKLKSLNLGYNQFIDILPLKKLIALQDLNLNSNPISNIEPLRNLSALETLNLFDTKVSDCSFLKELKRLQGLFLARCPIDNYSFFDELIGLKSLVLVGNSISNLQFMEKLTELQFLELSNNQIWDIHFIRKLTKLQYVNLSNNQISDISPLKHLATVQDLNLSNNKISDISPLKHLTALQDLNLSNNQIFGIYPIEKLTNLKTLNLSKNFISITSSIEKLTNLQDLNLSSNQIVNFQNQLFKTLPLLNRLTISNNPIDNIPEEIFDKIRQNVFQEVKDYFDSLEKKENVFPLYEAKLLLVGRGFVGKSELAEALTKDDYIFEEGRKQTEGIKIKEWHPNGCEKEGNNIDFKVNLWDFGGQEVYYGTHQFFLSKNAVYLLVWDARQEEDTRTFDYWLRAIGLLSQQSSVIIVQNKADQQTKELNQEDIVRNFPFVKGFYKTSCKLPNSYDNKKLQEHLVKELIALPHIGELWNKHRVAVRRILEEDSRNYISEEEYLKICTENTLKSKEPYFLSDRLHNLGVILHFQDDDTLKRTVILKPEWATSAFYKIIDSKHIKEQNKGSFDKKALAEVWNEEQYQSMIPELLKLMMKFELCFQYQNQDKYIVPEISSANPTFNIPAFPANQPVLEMVYQYEFMPKSIVTRFICRNHKDIKQDMFWQSGVVLEMDGCLALVESSEINKRITIKVSGNWANKVMYHIRKDIHIIHETVKNPPFDELIPCKSEECKSSGKPFYFKYETLIDFQKEGDKDIRCESCKKKMNIAELIEGVEDIERGQAKEIFRPIEIPTESIEKVKSKSLQIVKIFIASSYELKKDREAFRVFISSENDRLIKKSIYLEVVQWEYISDAVSDTRKQDDYNKYLKECDLQICLLGTKVGKYTREEFETAYNQFKSTGKPKIFTYFKQIALNMGEIDEANFKSYRDFKDYLRQIEHFPSEYENSTDLENKFKRNLEEYLKL